jgi:hypothetical protein
MDFYLDPGTLSVFYVQAVADAGFGKITGWRSVRPDIEVLTTEGAILSVVMKNGAVEVTEIGKQEAAAQA